MYRKMMSFYNFIFIEPWKPCLSTYKINAKCSYYVIKYNDKEDVGVCKIDDQCKFDAGSRAPKAGALGPPRGMCEEGGERGFRMVGYMYTHG